MAGRKKKRGSGVAGRNQRKTRRAMEKETGYKATKAEKKGENE